MSFINNLLIGIFSKEIGQDQFGNRYYVNNTQDYLRRFRRQVIYNGAANATKIPPMWHAWLHYMTDQLPNSEDRFVWQQEYSPHISGAPLGPKVVGLTGDKLLPRLEKDTRLLSKLASGKEFEGDEAHKTSEDSRLESLSKLPVQVECRKKSTEKNMHYSKWTPL